MLLYLHLANTPIPVITVINRRMVAHSPASLAADQSIHLIRLGSLGLTCR